MKIQGGIITKLRGSFPVGNSPTEARRMNQKRFLTVLLWSMLTMLMSLSLGNKAIGAKNIDPDNNGSQYAYGENVG